MNREIEIRERELSPEEEALLARTRLRMAAAEFGLPAIASHRPFKSVLIALAAGALLGRQRGLKLGALLSVAGAIPKAVRLLR